MNIYLKIYYQILPNPKNRKNKNKNEQSIKDQWNALKHTNICIVEVSEEERERKKKYLNIDQKDLKFGEKQ